MGGIDDVIARLELFLGAAAGAVGSGGCHGWGSGPMRRRWQGDRSTAGEGGPARGGRRNRHGFGQAGSRGGHLGQLGPGRRGGEGLGGPCAALASRRRGLRAGRAVGSTAGAGLSLGGATLGRSCGRWRRILPQAFGRGAAWRRFRSGGPGHGGGGRPAAAQRLAIPPSRRFRGDLPFARRGISRRLAAGRSSCDLAPPRRGGLPGGPAYARPSLPLPSDDDAGRPPSMKDIAEEWAAVIPLGAAGGPQPDSGQQTLLTCLPSIPRHPAAAPPCW